MNEQRKPEPSAGHVWRHLSGFAAVVERVVPGGPFPAIADWVGGGGSHVDALLSDPAWSCIGIETPAGRVMVGERRQSQTMCIKGLVTVARIINGMHVAVVEDGDTDALAFLAEHVAGWTLLPAPAPITTERRIAPVLGLPRCACGAAMPAGCKMCPGCAAEAAMQAPFTRTDREVFRRGVDAVLSDLVATVAERAAVMAAAELPPGSDPSAELHPETARDIVRALRAGKRWADGPIWQAYDRALAQGPGIAARPPAPAAPDVVHTWEAWALP